MTTYIICVTDVDSGQSCRVDYWADGYNQRRVPGYALNLADVVADVRDELGLRDVDLLYVTPDRKACHIDDNDVLRAAVEDLPHRGVLNVTVVKRKGGGGGKKKKKGKKKEKMMFDAPDSDSDSESDGDGGAGTRTYNVKGDKAIAKRFGAADMGWERCSPEAPLGREKGVPIREDVKHLQYLMTRLGLMPLSATEKYQGSYQWYTEQAVKAFRKAHGLTGGNMEAYDKKTAKKLGDEVRRHL